MADPYTVLRLCERGSGPYVLEDRRGLSAAAADSLATEWWQRSRSTVAVVVLRAGAMDALYERPGIGRDRIPEGWHWASKRPAMRKLTEDLDAATRPMPSLGDDVPKPVHPVGACLVCMQVPKTSDENERDRTPSGRLGRYCCPLCGSPLLPGTARHVEQRYIAAASGRSTPGEQP